MTSRADKHKYTGFKLISLDLRDTTLMGKSKLHYSFVEPDDEQKSIYTTVIIGANGTGKSNLFRIIIELFKKLEDLSNGKSRSSDVDGQFNLKFSLNGNVYEYGNINDSDNLKNINIHSKKGNTAYLLKNGREEGWERVQLPIAIVANSIMLTDKYPFFRKEINKQGEKIDAFQRYKYLGIRNIAQNASTRAYVRKTVEFINQEYKSSAFRKGLERATTFLGLAREIDIYYHTSNNAKFFRGNLTAITLDEYFEDIRIKYSKSEDNPPFKLSQYLKIKNNKKLVRQICDFCNELVKRNRLVKPDSKYSSLRKIIYNIIDSNSFAQLNDEYLMLEHLRQLGIISPPEIELKRAGGYSLQESSSGEYHFFSSVVGLMATVKTDSLVFIDEPEISLHPNWQMKYLTFIRELFASPEYATSHILVATHSHFIISDLKAESSKIIGLKRESEKIELVELPKGIDTYGWSTEDVLYKVFGVRTTRNYYMEVDLRKLLHSISEQKKNKAELENILNRLEKVKLNKDDPLNLILEKAKAYIQKI